MYKYFYIIMTFYADVVVHRNMERQQSVQNTLKGNEKQKSKRKPNPSVAELVLDESRSSLILAKKNLQKNQWI